MSLKRRCPQAFEKRVVRVEWPEERRIMQQFVLEGRCRLKDVSMSGSDE